MRPKQDILVTHHVTALVKTCHGHPISLRVKAQGALETHIICSPVSLTSASPLPSLPCLPPSVVSKGQACACLKAVVLRHALITCKLVLRSQILWRSTLTFLIKTGIVTPIRVLHPHPC